MNSIPILLSFHITESILVQGKPVSHASLFNFDGVVLLQPHAHHRCSLILSPSCLSKHQYFTSSRRYIIKPNPPRVYIVNSDRIDPSAIMGLLDKLKGKKKADSSKAGNSALPFYLTLKWASISISLPSRITERTTQKALSHRSRPTGHQRSLQRTQRPALSPLAPHLPLRFLLQSPQRSTLTSL